MTKLKLETIEDDKPVNRMVKFPGAVYRDLTAYAEVLAHDGQSVLVHEMSGRSQRWDLSTGRAGPPFAEDTGIGLVISTAASVINLVVARMLFTAGKKHRSITLEADAHHLMTDVWTSVGVVVGVIVACQIERSQPKNRAKAMSMLKAKLYALKLDQAKSEMEKFYGEKGEIGFGAQIRSYVLQPYQMVKDLRTGVEKGNANGVLDGDIDAFLEATLAQKLVS